MSPHPDARPEVLGVRLVGELQERAARAVPAAVQERRDGCWLRLTDSSATWWAGAVLLHGVAHPSDLARAIAVAEDFYAAHGAPVRFQVCPACPADLDDALCARGYRRHSAVSLQVASSQAAAATTPASAVRVVLTDAADAAWVDLLVAAQGGDTDPAAELRLLERVDRPSTFATALVAGSPVAVGRAVADDGWVGVFGMATLPDARRQGAAGAVLAALAGWAAGRGDPQMYLQVTRDSSAALRLYRRSGFTQAATYHYRAAAARGK